ncbi:hypothetical protein CUMW_258040, partial [Citrus unshiu]
MAFVAELLAVILAIEHAYFGCWTMPWIKCESALTLLHLRNKRLPPMEPKLLPLYWYTPGTEVVECMVYDFSELKVHSMDIFTSFSKLKIVSRDHGTYGTYVGASIVGKCYKRIVNIGKISSVFQVPSM